MRDRGEVDVTFSCVVPYETGVLTIGFDEDGGRPDVGEGVAREDDEVVPALVGGRVAEENVGANYVEGAGVVADAVRVSAWDESGGRSFGGTLVPTVRCGC